MLAVLVASSACASASDASSGTQNAPPELTESSLLPAGCDEFQKLVDATYNFKPSKLSEAQQTEKSKEMDAVWEKVKAETKALQPCLEAALDSPSANPFFRFDGSTLLLSVDKSEATKNLVIRSYARAELDDIVLQHWIANMLKFGFEGLDTSEAGEAWLRAKDPSYYLPQHGTLKVDKEAGALAIFGSMDEKYATPALAKIASQKDHPGREIAVSLLVKQVTAEALKALTELDKKGLSEQARSAATSYVIAPDFIEKRTGEPKITREAYVKAFEELANGRPSLFMDLVDQVPDGEKDAVAVLQASDDALVRKARRYFASTGSPHAADWYQSFTDILMVLVRKPEFDKKTVE